MRPLNLKVAEQLFAAHVLWSDMADLEEHGEETGFKKGLPKREADKALHVYIDYCEQEGI